MLLDAEEDVVGLVVLLVRVVEVVRGHERDAEAARDLDEGGRDLRLVGQPVVLELDVERALPEDVAVGGGGLLGLLPLIGQEVPAHLGGEAAREPDQPLGVAGEQLLVDPRTVVEALEVGVGDEPQEVPVAGLVPGQDREVPVLLLVLAGVAVEPRARRHVGLDAEDRLDPSRPGLTVEVERAEHHAVVGEADRRHPHLGGPVEHRGRAAARRDAREPV
ncbi:MAG TPA: hypothetical protein VF058_06810, partial [Actinomycetota bacterium]